MLLPFDYCLDPDALLPLSRPLRAYAHARGLSDVAALERCIDAIRHQRETQLQELEKLAYNGNETAQMTLVAYYLDHAYEGTLLNTWYLPCLTCSPTEEEAEPYARDAVRIIARMQTSASADALFALTRQLEDKRAIANFNRLYYACLNGAACKGHGEAQLMLATLYFRGDTDFKPDRILGLRWLRRAAEHNTEAAEWLAEIKKSHKLP